MDVISNNKLSNPIATFGKMVKLTIDLVVRDDVTYPTTLSHFTS